MVRIHHATLTKARKFHIALSLEENNVVATDKSGRRLASGLQGNKVLEEAIVKLTGHPAKKAVVKAPRKVHTPSMVEADEASEEPSDEDFDTDVEIEAAEDEPDADQSRSIVKSKYKALYRPHRDMCGDDLSKQIHGHVTRTDEETGETRVDLRALRDFAKANDCWQPAYASLVSRTGGWNAGMARMNVANRLRAKIRRARKDGEEFDIQWV